MGAYLSEPVTEKISEDSDCDSLKYGASSMQGWRVSQEDAHNTIIEFDKNCHLFAVYDGHGGSEVSAYTALHLPKFIKELESYKSGKFEQALIDAFLGFDKHLTEQTVINTLKSIAGAQDDDDDDESESEEVNELYKEATMPIDELKKIYTAENPALARVKGKPTVSPFLKAKTEAKTQDGDKPITMDMEAEKEEEGGSSSSAQGSSSSASSACKENGLAEKPNESSNSQGTKEEAVVNGDESKASDCSNSNGDAKKENGEKDACDGEKSNGVKKENETKETSDVVNGETENVGGKGKGKGGKGGKGKALLKNSEVQAMREEEAREQKRLTAIRAAEIYRRLQEEEEMGEEEEEDEDDDNFEDNSDGDDDEDLGEDDDDEDEDDEDEEDLSDDDEDGPEADEDEETYNEFAETMKEEPGYDSGCTACLALFVQDQLYVANVGDSRCVVSRGGQAVDMSIDHKPEDDEETARILKAGGKVTSDGRVNGGLNLSRAIGDHGYKQNKSLPAAEQMISPLPDVKCLSLTPEDDFVIVACDGIWNSLTSQEAVDFVKEKLKEDVKISDICEQLFDDCLAPDTHGDGTGCDNMTCIIIKLKEPILNKEGNKRSLDENGEDSNVSKKAKTEQSSSQVSDSPTDSKE